MVVGADGYVCASMPNLGIGMPPCYDGCVCAASALNSFSTVINQTLFGTTPNRVWVLDVVSTSNMDATGT